MKKILFLMLSLAVASSAIAGPVKLQKNQISPSAKGVELTKAPTLAYQNVQTMNINAPKVLIPQHEAVPGLRLLERMSAATRAVVTEQPDGTVTYYKRTAGVGLYYASNTSPYVEYSDQSGIVTVVENGNTVWFKNLFYDGGIGLFGTYWIQGTKNSAGTQITIAKAQDVAYSSNYDAYVRIGTATMQAQTVSTNYPYGYRMRNLSKTGNITFNISNGVLTMANSQSSGGGAGSGIVTYWSDDDAWYPCANYATQLTPMGDIPEAPEIYTDDDIDEMDGELVRYNRTGYCWKRMYDANGSYLGVGIDEQTGYGYVFYDEDGETVYLRDPVSGATIFSDVVGHWIKGTKDGNTLSFPVNQYIMWDDEFYGVKVNYGLLVEDTTTNYLTYTPLDDVTEFTYTIDEAAGTITLNDVGYIDEAMTQFVGIGAQLDSAYTDPGWLGALDFYTVYYSIPGVPTELTVQEGSTTANVSWTPGTANTSWNVRYREYVDPSTIDYYFCDFEGENDLNDWWGMNLDGDDYWWQGWEAEDGNNYLASASYINGVGAQTPDNLLCSPELTLNGVVKLNAWGIDANYAAEVFKVYIFVGDTTTIEGIGDFIAISEDVTVNGEVTEYTFAIPEEYWGQQGYIAIRHYNVTDQYWLAIDDIYVGDPDGASPWIYVYDVEDPATVLQGLTPETTYEVQVQGANDGGVGVWTESVVFTTLAEQPQPTLLRGDVDGNGKVNLDDLTALINYLVGFSGPDDIAFENAAICDSLTGDASEGVGLDDLTSLINFLVYGTWPN